MFPGNDSSSDLRDDPHDRLRHDLKTPLATAHACAQLVARMMRRSSSLAELERTGMLDGLAAVEQALRAMVPLIDGIGRKRLAGAPGKRDSEPPR
jgi:hypothetical protein